MQKLIILYVGTFFLALLSQKYHPIPIGSNSRQHFMRDRMDIFTVAIVVWLTLFSGLRTNYNDTGQYIIYFREAATSLAEHFATSTETGFADNPLYYIVEVIFKGVLNNYHAWFVFTSFISSWVMVKFFRHYSHSYAWAILLYIAVGTYIMYIAAIKQALAVAILMCAIPYANRRNWLVFYALVILAILFHTHAFLFAVVPFLLGKPWGKRTWTAFLLTFVAMLTYNTTFGAFLNFAQSIGANVVDIEVFDGHSVNFIRIVVYAVVPVMALIFRKRLFSHSTKMNNLFVNMCVVGWFILMIGTVNGGNLFARMAGYFEWGVAIALPWMIFKLFTRQSQKLVFSFAGLLYTVYFLYEFGISKGFDSDYIAITFAEFVRRLFA